MVDILMATYNGEKFIKEQIDSIIAQTYQDWNLYIHDDGSTDNTVAVIKTYVDSRIHLIDDNVRFGNSTRNFLYLIENCVTSDYFMFSDQDDFWLPNKIQVTLDELIKLEDGDKTVPICVGTDLKVVDSSLNVIDSSFYNYSKFISNSDFSTLLIENVFTGCTMCMNKVVVSYIKKLNSFYDNIIQHDWFIALICASEGYISQLPISTMLYRQHGNNEVGANKFSFFKSFSIMKYKYKIKKIIGIKLRLFKQLKQLCDILNSDINKQLITDYVESRGLKHKYVIVNKKLARSLVISKTLLKVILY